MSVRLGPGVCGTLDEAARREWLVADGIGGYAMGTVAGSTRHPAGTSSATFTDASSLVLLVTETNTSRVAEVDCTGKTACVGVVRTEKAGTIMSESTPNTSRAFTVVSGMSIEEVGAAWSEIAATWFIGQRSCGFSGSV